MKKIIAAIIRFFMPKAVMKHEREEKARHIHNANVLQNLLDKEHNIRDKYNSDNNTVFTTKEAIRKAYVAGKTDYNGYSSLNSEGYRLK